LVCRVAFAFLIVCLWHATGRILPYFYLSGPSPMH